MLQKSFVEPKSVGQVVVPLPARAFGGCCRLRWFGLGVAFGVLSLSFRFPFVVGFLAGFLRVAWCSFCRLGRLF